MALLAWGLIVRNYSQVTSILLLAQKILSFEVTFAKIATVDFFAFKKIILACFGQKLLGVGPLRFCALNKLRWVAGILAKLSILKVSNHHWKHRNIPP